MHEAPRLFYQLALNELDYLAPLFESAFNTPFPSGLIAWKYKQGQGESWIDGNIKNIEFHYGVLWRRAMYFGNERMAAQLVDLMGAKSSRKVSKRNTSFFRLSDFLIRERIPSQIDSDLVYGMPSQRAMRLGKHVGVYSSAGHIYLSRLPAKRRRFSRYAIKELCAEDSHLKNTAHKLWSRMLQSGQDCVMIMRDADYIVERYVHHPSDKYRFLVCSHRISCAPLGLAVVSRASNLHIHDIISHFDDMPLLLRSLQDWTAKQGIQELEMLGSKRVKSLFSRIEADSTKMEFEIMANPHMNPNELARIQDRWWFTSGDTDYF